MWVITADIIEAGKNKGLESTFFVKGEKLPYEFRLLDADGGIYYRGRSSCGSSFAPLDDFARGWSGCCTIQYWEKGLWVEL